MSSAAYKLNDDVEIIRRRSALLLFSRGTGRSVRVSSVGTELLPLLQAGSTFDELRSSLLRVHPRAADVGSKLGHFLNALSGAGILLNDTEHARIRAGHDRRFPLFRLDPLARRLVGALTFIFPRSWIALGAVLAGIAAIMALAALASLNGLPSLRTSLEQIRPIGLLLFALIVVPLHELAHATACRFAGVEVGESGIVLHGGFVPGPYVDTSQAYRITDRLLRFMIPLAGPLTNLIAGGVVAAVLLFVSLSPAWIHTLQTLLLACLLFVYFDTNPLSPSDGSHCIEAWLDDELARHYALRLVKLETTDRTVVMRYRLAIAIHVGISALLFLIWW